MERRSDSDVLALPNQEPAQVEGLISKSDLGERSPSMAFPPGSDLESEQLLLKTLNANRYQKKCKLLFIFNY
jgi:hypothetical protein